MLLFTPFFTTRQMAGASIHCTFISIPPPLRSFVDFCTEYRITEHLKFDPTNLLKPLSGWAALYLTCNWSPISKPNFCLSATSTGLLKHPPRCTAAGGTFRGAEIALEDDEAQAAEEDDNAALPAQAPDEEDVVRTADEEDDVVWTASWNASSVTSES